MGMGRVVMFRKFLSRSEEAADSRRFPRFNSRKIRFRMDGRELDVMDISATGIQVRGAPTWIVSGQGLVFDLLVPVRGGTTVVEASGRVVRRDERSLVVAYQSPHPNWRRLLTDFLAKQ